MINILYMGHSRIRYFEYFMRMFITMRNRGNVRILLMLPIVNSIWENRKATLEKLGFHVVLQKFDGGGNYKDKLFKSFSYPSKYTIKIDEDIFCSAQSMDFMIDNADTYITDKNFILTPLLSTGIPTVDRFMSQNFSTEEATSVTNIFKGVGFGHMWGSDYSTLNQCTVYSSSWSPENFFSVVKKLPTCFKGIHPVRVSVEAQTLIHNITMSKIHSLLSNNNFTVTNLKFPYICNSFFMIKTDVWKEVLGDLSTWVDLYDEVPLNLYMQRHDKDIAFIDGSFVVHPSYNTIGELYTNISDQFYNSIMRG